MAGFILGEKLKQSQMINDKGERIPVTFIKTSPCYLVDIKWPKKHGYLAVKLGFGTVKNIKKPVQGELAKAGIKTPLRFLREIRLENFPNTVKVVEEEKKPILVIDNKKFSIGQELNSSILFCKGDLVNVSGISKGKGFQGVVKRHHFAGGPRTHGQSDRERAPGSIGQTTTPGRVYKGKRMAGRMGRQRVTIKNLKVVAVKEDGLTIAGLVAGAKGGLLEIKSMKPQVKN